MALNPIMIVVFGRKADKSLKNLIVILTALWVLICLELNLDHEYNNYF